MKNLFSRPTLALAFTAGGLLTVAGFVFGAFIPVNPLAQMGALAVLAGIGLLSLGMAVLFTEFFFVRWFQANTNGTLSTWWQLASLVGLSLVALALIGVMRLLTKLPDGLVPLIGDFLMWLVIVPLFIVMLPLLVVVVSLSIKLDHLLEGRIVPGKKAETDASAAGAQSGETADAGTAGQTDAG